MTKHQLSSKLDRTVTYDIIVGAANRAGIARVAAKNDGSKGAAVETEEEI